MHRKLLPNRDRRSAARTARAVIALTTLAVLALIPNPRLSAETRTVTADQSLRASAAYKWFLGSDYREVWSTQIEVEVLDLQKVAGGLRPLFRVGGLQTHGLALSGADGKSYTFRSLVKDLGQVLPEDFRDYLIDDAFQDQLSSTHPGAVLIVPPLAEAAGVLYIVPRLVIMPDDPALGEFREVFADRLGTLEQYPTPASGRDPGFHGATEILSSAEMWPKMLADATVRIDTKAFLRARLFDFFIGDWDRHPEQWRWAKLPGKSGWQPIPEDRDEAFSNHDGFVFTLFRPFLPTRLVFRDEYPRLTGLTLQGWQIHRWLLPELDRATWIEVATDIRDRLTNAVIDEAMRQMPPPYYEASAEEIANKLRERRDSLPEIAARVYLFLAAEVDVQGTNQSEHVEIHGLDQGRVAVSLAAQTAKGRTPYFRREFSPSETRSLRFYLREGNDTVSCHGQVSRKIKIEVIGRAEQDAIEGCEAVQLRFTEIEEAAGRQIPPRPVPPSLFNPVFDEEGASPPVWVRPRDWGYRIVPSYQAGFSSDDLGLLLGGGVTIDRFAFGKTPFAERHIMSAAYAFGYESFDLRYTGTYQHWNAKLQSSLAVIVSGLEQVRFFGFGNETSDDDGGVEDFFETRQVQVNFTPSLRYLLSPRVEIFGGSRVTYSSTSDDDDTLLKRLSPYGAGDFGQLGFFAGFDLDTRDRTMLYGPGMHLRLQGSVFPGVWDVDETFGAVEGEMAGYVGLGRRSLLALRVGGKNVFGTFPFHEAAYIGGNTTVRGYDPARFAGDASVFANGELRWTVGEATALLFRGEYGLFIFGDVGRVFSDEDDHSTKWHPSFGGGVSLSAVERSILWSLTVAHGEEQTSVFLLAGFSF